MNDSKFLKNNAKNEFVSKTQRNLNRFLSKDSGKVILTNRHPIVPKMVENENNSDQKYVLTVVIICVSVIILAIIIFVLYQIWKEKRLKEKKGMQTDDKK